MTVTERENIHEHIDHCTRYTSQNTSPKIVRHFDPTATEMIEKGYAYHLSSINDDDSAPQYDELCIQIIQNNGPQNYCYFSLLYIFVYFFMGK